MPEKIPKKVYDLRDLIIQNSDSKSVKITDSSHPYVSWELHYEDKNIYYITTNIGQKERLSCLWKYFSPKFFPPQLLVNMGDYESIMGLWQSQNLSLSQMQRLIFQLNEEALSQIFNIENPILEFSCNQHILSPIAQFSWESILHNAYHKSTLWKNVTPTYLSPFNRLYLDSNKTYQFYQFWKSQKNLDQKQTPRISFWLLSLAQKKSIYQLSQERGILPLAFIKEFQYLLQANIIEILPFSEKIPQLSNQNNSLSKQETIKSFTSSSPIIACIDDSRTVQKHIQKILAMMGYQTLSLTDPTLCLTTLAKYNPKLILLDINMPEMTGYELCKILQKSSKLREIPIVMLTGRDGLVDKLRAKMLGVEHYLTKPCQPQEIFDVVKSLTCKQSVDSSKTSYVKSS